MTLDQFKKHSTHSEELRAFLSSAAGRALKEVMAAEHPLRKLSHPETSNKRTTKKAEAFATQASAPGLLQELIGYDMALRYIFDLCPAVPEAVKPARRPNAAGIAASRIDT